MLIRIFKLAVFIAMIAILTACAPTRSTTKAPTAAPSQLKQYVDVKQYVDELVQIMSDRQVAVDQLVERFSELVDNRTMVYDESWRASALMSIMMVQQANVRLRSISPPPQFAEYHAVLVESADQYDIGVEFYIEGLKAGDEQVIISGLDAFVAGADIVISSMDEFEKITR